MNLIFFFVSFQIVPEFHFILFRFAVFASFSFWFTSFHFCFASDVKISEKNTCFSAKWKKFRFCFTSFCFEAKIMAVFCFFCVLFSLHLIFVSLQISTFCINAKTSKKCLFLHQEKKFFLLSHFILLRSENDSASYSWSTRTVEAGVGLGVIGVQLVLHFPYSSCKRRNPPIYTWGNSCTTSHSITSRVTLVTIK
jgi:hypothetical protein